jgi:anaerobic selenocysteine-containing dehydrogenase
MSFLLPYLLEGGKRSLDVYFTRVYNPAWTNPDGFSWIRMLKDEQRIGLHAALTPTWNETAQYADYVLPMGIATERHDLHSYETHASQWIGFRQPVQRVLRERLGRPIEFTYESNVGEVWEENEFWIELSWRIDPDGSLGIRRYFESPYRPGEKIRIDEYYRYLFEHVPGLPEAASEKGMDPLEYMQRIGAFEVATDVYEEHEAATPSDAGSDGEFAWAPSPKRVNFRPYPGPFLNAEGQARAGVNVEGELKKGFPTPSGKLEFFSLTLRDWGWPELALPIYPRTESQFELMHSIVSQVHYSRIDSSKSEYALLPTFRLPTLIHTRTNGAKWLYETANENPVWVNPADASRIGVATGDLVRVQSEIGYFVDRVWVTEAIHPGVVACSHHLGRWRLFEDHGSDRWNSALVELEEADGVSRMKQKHGASPFASSDPDSSRIWWSDGGVHQNLIFPVQPDPISGQHCWHQKVSVFKAEPEERYGDIVVESEKAREAYGRWLALTRPAPGPDGTRRPYWLLRPLKPRPPLYRAPAS